MGNLAIGSRGTIKIGKSAELNINNNVVLHRFSYDDESEQQIYMTLNEGSKLSFGGNARIHNNTNYDTPVKLNIYMKGGTVNLSGLDADSRQLVNLIYDEAEPNFSDNIKILGNPVSDNLRFSMTSDYVSDVTISLFSIDGKRVLNEFQFINKGINYIETDISNLPNGLYFLHLQSETETFTDKILIMR
ncbi:MAG: T9SS type A sorting domain-containing protein [Saprospiraceae bacterium]|nr:T9SS type A sorting domain-containing protein [Saprospiraceae bacterium]